MECIRLLNIRKDGNRIEYNFTVSEGLKGYFSGKPFVIEYPESVEAVPEAILSVPFASCVLPLIWIADARLELAELDKTFWDCLPELKKGYEAMYPETVFAGTIQVGSIVPCHRRAEGKTAAYFSGGLDSVQTLIRHLEEKPALISIWGSDVNFDNEAGWELVSAPIREYAEKYGLEAVTIRSGFREFDLEWELDKVYQQQLRSNWWYGVKHGIALLGHAAPYAYLKGISTVYIASSNSADELEIRCASDPTLDNHVRFADCRVNHDGFEFGRQAKVHNIVEYVRSTGKQLTLHVCWESQAGSNCCECEKCYRTMAGLMAEGENPVGYGFENGPETLGKMRRVLIGQKKLKENVAIEWLNIHRTMVKNQKSLQNQYYWKYVRWIAESDFENWQSLKLPLSVRIWDWFSQFPVLQKLYNLRKLF
jgi:7-cyano-7-deazaguanine synthase in queuosine biosynthesis